MTLNEALKLLRKQTDSLMVMKNKKLMKIYKALYEDLDKFVAYEYKEYADKDGRLYMAYLNKQNRKAKFMQEIIKKVDIMSPKLERELEKLINKTYEISYKGMAEAMQYTDITPPKVNKYVLKQAMQNNIDSLELAPILEQHKGKIKYQIQQEITIGLIAGDRYETMAKRIAERCGISLKTAQTIARTETHKNTEGGFMDCAEKIQESLKGSDDFLVAVWQTMKDERVRPYSTIRTKSGLKVYKTKTKADHTQMQDKAVKVGDYFDLGNGVKTKAPLHSGDPANDYNCRCYIEYDVMNEAEFKEYNRK